MSQDKEIIKKLFAIASKQQKILTKLAQNSPLGDASKDVTDQFQEVLLKVTGGRGDFEVVNARGPLADGSTRVQMKVPVNDPKTNQVIEMFKSQVAQLPAFSNSFLTITKMMG